MRITRGRGWKDVASTAAGADTDTRSLAAARHRGGDDAIDTRIDTCEVSEPGGPRGTLGISIGVRDRPARFGCGQVERREPRRT